MQSAVEEVNKDGLWGLRRLRFNVIFSANMLSAAKTQTVCVLRGDAVVDVTDAALHQ